MNAKHTPTPWTVSGNGIHKGIQCVATTHMEPKEQRDADAAFIVRACNVHDELLAIADKLVRAWPRRDEPGYAAIIAEATDEARAARAHARGE